MDILDRVAEPGRDLLARVDSVLAAAGAPADHPLWPLLRTVGALPGDVLDAYLALRPGELADAEVRLRARAEACAGERDDLAAAVSATGWTGAAATAFAGRWAVLGEHLGGPGIAGRLSATASYLDEVAGWMRAARADLAHEVAAALGSAEAVQVRVTPAGGPGPATGATRAAAEIAVRVLSVAERQSGVAEQVAGRWAGPLAELAFDDVDGLRRGARVAEPSGPADDLGVRYR